MKIDSLYMPDSCLQGDSFPAHVIWNKSTFVEITLNLPLSITIKDIFNIQEEGFIQKSPNCFVFTKFDVNGYIGLVFISKFYDQPKVEESIEFEIVDINTQEKSTHTKKIELFRPLITLENVPKTINVDFDSKTNDCILSEKIKLKNRGDGTALIAVESIFTENFIRSAPSGYDSFVKKFIEDLEIKMIDIKSKFQDYSSIIDDFINLMRHPVSLTDEFRENIKRLDQELTKICEENEIFRDEFITAIVISYIENIELITEIRSFMEYLNSIGKGRIVLLNSIEVMKPKKTNGQLQLQIQMTDLAYHNFPEINLPKIEIVCDRQCEIPIHSLFEWN